MTPATSNFWPTCLEALQHQMTHQTFSAWVQRTTLRVEDDGVIVCADSAYAMDWLQNRLAGVITRTIQQVAGEPLKVRFAVKEGNGNHQVEMRFVGEHRDVYSEIVQPGRSHYTSWYFHRAWLPLLGPDMWMLIWEMRTRCYWNRETGVKRDTFEATNNELAEAIGVSLSTVNRLLHPKKEPLKTYFAMFVTRLKTKRRYSKIRAGTVNERTIWKVQLEDPLTPDDQKEYDRLTGKTSE